MHIYICEYIYSYICIYICIFICIYIYMPIYPQKHTHITPILTSVSAHNSRKTSHGGALASSDASHSSLALASRTRRCQDTKMASPLQRGQAHPQHQTTVRLPCAAMQRAHVAQQTAVRAAAAHTGGSANPVLLAHRASHALGAMAATAPHSADASAVRLALLSGASACHCCARRGQFERGMALAGGWVCGAHYLRCLSCLPRPPRSEASGALATHAASRGSAGDTRCSRPLDPTRSCRAQRALSAAAERRVCHFSAERVAPTRSARYSSANAGTLVDAAPLCLSPPGGSAS